MPLPEVTEEKFSTDKIGLACYLMLRGFELATVLVKSKSRATFVFQLSPLEGITQEMTYTTSDFSRFFETFKYLRGRTLRGG